MTKTEFELHEMQATPDLQTAITAGGQLLVIAGNFCPHCGRGVMDYDGLLNLVCQVCKFTEGGCFT